jgi:hypothetical protein
VDVTLMVVPDLDVHAILTPTLSSLQLKHDAIHLVQLQFINGTAHLRA